MPTRRGRTTRRTADPQPQNPRKQRPAGRRASFVLPDRTDPRPTPNQGDVSTWGEKGAGNAGTHSEYKVAVPRADPDVRRRGPAARARTRRGTGGREGLEPLGGAADQSGPEGRQHRP